MGGVLVGAVVGAIVSAIVTVYLQKRLTRDPAVEIAALREQVASLQAQVAAFQRGMETFEQERVDSEHFRLGISLQHAMSQNYSMFVTNDSDDEVEIETVEVFWSDSGNDVPLSEPSKPKATDNWKLPPRSPKVICWAPQHDPTMALRWIKPQLHNGTVIPIVLVITCKVRGRRRTVRRTQSVTVDYSNSRMTPYGP